MRETPSASWGFTATAGRYNFSIGDAFLIGLAVKYLPKVSHLQALRQVARGSIRSAARELGQSQPALSRTLRELEQTLGTQLCCAAKRITLTEAGSAFSLRAEWVLEELRRAADEVEQINQVTHGRLTIAFHR